MKKKILIVEDEEDLLEEISEILRYESYEVTTAVDGQIGWNLAVQFEPDIIISDLLMPELNGMELIKKIRTHSKLAETPVIILSAVSEYSSMRKGMTAGANDYLVKPFTRNELLDTLNARLRTQEINEKKLNDLRKKIIHAIPHEIRTPLHAIMGLGEILIDDGDKLPRAELTKIAASIADSAKRLNHHLTKYQLFVELETFNCMDAMKPAVIEPAILFTIVEDFCEKYNRKKDVEVNAFPFQVHIKDDWMLFVFQEILDNALKFSEPGQKVLLDVLHQNGNIILYVKDHGRGFQIDSIKAINAFEQFDRHKKEQQGLGLGLVLVKKIMEKHKGSLFIESTEKTGTVVRLTLPGEPIEHISNFEV